MTVLESLMQSDYSRLAYKTYEKDIQAAQAHLRPDESVLFAILGGVYIVDTASAEKTQHAGVTVLSNQRLFFIGVVSSTVKEYPFCEIQKVFLEKKSISGSLYVNCKSETFVICSIIERLSATKILLETCITPIIPVCPYCDSKLSGQISGSSCPNCGGRLT